MKKQKKKTPALDTSGARAPMTFDELIADTGNTVESVTAWGGTVLIMAITAGEALDYIEPKDVIAQREAGFRMVAKSMVDALHKRLCKSVEDEDRMIGALRSKDASTCNMLMERVLALNKIDPKNLEAIKNVSGAAG